MRNAAVWPGMLVVVVVTEPWRRQFATTAWASAVGYTVPLPVVGTLGAGAVAAMLREGAVFRGGAAGAGFDAGAAGAAGAGQRALHCATSASWLYCSALCDVAWTSSLMRELNAFSMAESRGEMRARRAAQYLAVAVGPATIADLSSSGTVTRFDRFASTSCAFHWPLAVNSTNTGAAIVGPGGHASVSSPRASSSASGIRTSHWRSGSRPCSSSRRRIHTAASRREK